MLPSLIVALTMDPNIANLQVGGKPDDPSLGTVQVVNPANPTAGRAEDA
jgi:hypothetical protein